MTTVLKNNARSANRRPAPWGLALIGLLLLLAIAAVSLLLSPVGQRLAADQLAQPPVVGVDRVIIQADPRLNHVFSPAVIEVAAGTTVTWEFAELDDDGLPVAHNVVFDYVASPVQETGTFSVTFDEPGSYTYVCTLHPFMEGRVDVVAE